MIQTSDLLDAKTVRKKRIFYTARLAICVSLIAFVLFRYDATSALAKLRQANFPWLLAAGVSFYFGIFLKSVKWKRILNGYGRKESLFSLFAYYIEACFFNLLFPGFIAGDVSRVARTSQDISASMESALAVFLERFSGLITFCSFVGLIALFGGYKALGSIWHRAILFAIGLILISLFLLLNIRFITVCASILPNFIRVRIQAIASKTQAAINKVMHNPLLLFEIILLSLLLIIPMVAANYFIARAINMYIPPVILFMYIPLIALLVDLPLTIAGIGVRENIYIVLFSALGFMVDDIIALGLYNSTLIILINLSGGVLLLLRSASLKYKQWI